MPHMAPKAQIVQDVYKGLRIWYLFGLMLSGYAFYVEYQAVKDQNYRALCDLSETVSCTAVFNSPYGKTFGILYYFYGKDADKNMLNPPNGLLGVIYYFTFFLTTFFAQRYLRWLYVIQFVACIITNMLSFYLAYLLYFVLEDLCVICATVYVVNLLCLHRLSKVYKEIFTTKQPTSPAPPSRRKKRN